MLRWTFFASGILVIVAILNVPGAAPGAERPRLVLNGGGGGDKYFCTANVGVSGSVEPPLNAGVEVRYFHVQDDGGLVYQAGNSVAATDGKFGPLSTQPPPGGWLPGKLRCIVYLNQMKHVRSSFDVEIVGQNLPPPQAIYEPKLSNVVADVDHPPAGGWTVTAGERFFVTGTFGTPGLKGVQGPAVIVEIIQGGPGRQNEVTVQSGMSYGLSDDRKQCNFEVELTTPTQPGKYHLRVKIPAYLDEKRIIADLEDVPLVLTAPPDSAVKTPDRD